MRWKNLIALRFFNTAKHNSFTNLARNISIYSISFATCILIVVLSVVRGFHHDMLHKILQDQGHISIVSMEKNFNPDEIKPLIQSESYTETIEIIGLVMSARNVQPVTIKSTDLEQTIIGTGLADSLNCKLSEKISAIVPVKAPAPFQFLPENFEFHADCIKEFESYEENNHVIFVNKLELQKKLNIGHKVQKILIYLNNINECDKKVAQLREILPPGYKAFSWKERNRSLLKILNMEKNMIFIVLFAIILLAILLAVFSTILLINIKAREISVLKILGASNADIVNIFIKISLLTSFIGSLQGAILGVILTKNIDKIRIYAEKILGVQFFDPQLYLIPQLPTLLQYSDVALIVALNLFFTLSASMFASRKAARINALTNL